MPPVGVTTDEPVLAIQEVGLETILPVILKGAAKIVAEEIAAHPFESVTE